jgi:AcrR family transcriptional regulator
MELIIARSGLSTGAVYGYFKGKDELITAAVGEGMSSTMDAFSALFDDPDPPSLPVVLETLLSTTLAPPLDSDFSRMILVLHGYSHMQTSPALRSAVQAQYKDGLQRCASMVKRMQANGNLDPDIDPSDVAQLFTSICWGFFHQHALSGGPSVEGHIRALSALTSPKNRKA